MLTLMTSSYPKYAVTGKWFVIFSSSHALVQKDMLLKPIFNILMTPKYKKKTKKNQTTEKNFENCAVGK